MSIPLRKLRSRVALMPCDVAKDHLALALKLLLPPDKWDAALPVPPEADDEAWEYYEYFNRHTRETILPNSPQKAEAKRWGGSLPGRPRRRDRTKRMHELRRKCINAFKDICPHGRRIRGDIEDLVAAVRGLL